MKLPKLEKPEKYVGLYIFDFGDHDGLRHFCSGLRSNQALF